MIGSKELIKKFPPEFLYKYGFIPVKEENGFIHILISDPDDIIAIDEIENLTGKRVKAEKADKQKIYDILREAEIAVEFLKSAGSKFEAEEEKDKGKKDILIESITEEDPTIIKLVNSMIFTAVEKMASDIHIEGKEDKIIVKYRIDGVLVPAMTPLSKSYHENIISRIKIMADLDISEKRIPQDGKFRLPIKGREIDFRVSIMPTIYGEDAVIRILDREMITRSIHELKLDVLGFSKNLLKKLRKYIYYPYGMILITGPTGSGKTTTLYAILNEIKTGEEKIITIEDPVEYQIDGITQINVNEKAGLTFAKGLRSILRHDPDKIMVGEIRDRETAEIAIQAALTGHLVLSTVHANNAFDVIGRFLHMGIDRYSFVSAINCIISQRLVRVLCEKCKVISNYSDDALKTLGIPLELGKSEFYEPQGCAECNFTGYKGRTAIGEILEFSDTIRDMILDKKPPSEIRKEAIKEGMVLMRKEGLRKVEKGITSISELNKVTFAEESEFKG